MKFYLDAWIKEGQKGSSCACGLSLGSGAPQFALGEKRRFRPETKGADSLTRNHTLIDASWMKAR